MQFSSSSEPVANAVTLDQALVRGPAVAAARPAARHAATVGRLLLGLIFFVCGINGFLDFLPRPTAPMSEGAIAFGLGLVKSGYMFPLLAGTQALVGALLLANRFVPLALAVIAPVIINIVAFHLFLAPSGLGLAVILLAIEVYLAWSYRSAYRTILAARSAVG